MLGVLFWNTGIKRNNFYENPDKIDRIQEALIEIVSENDCDIIILAESPPHIAGLCDQLSVIGKDFKERRAIQDTRVKILASAFLRSEIIRDSRYYVIHDFRIADRHFLLCGVHFPSKLHTDSGDIQSVGGKFMEAAREAEQAVRHKKVMITGDFNANPFEDVMVRSNYLHAISNAAIVRNKRYRTVLENQSQMFYNPMWNLLGDSNFPNGTYYSESGKTYQLYWNHFDQVIMSADFIKAYQRDSLKIITRTSHRVLYNSSGRPDAANYSDHFPIFFSFQEDLL